MTKAGERILAGMREAVAFAQGEDTGARVYVPSVHQLMPPLPEYVEHRDGVNAVGKLSAEAVVREYEAAAKEIEAMGEELKVRLEKLEQAKVDAMTVLAEIKETAASYRDAGKRIFLQIEDVSMMTSEVRTTCGELKAKIAGPSS